MLIALTTVALANEVLFSETVQGGLSLDASGASGPYDGSSTLYAGDDLVVQVPSTATITDIRLVLLPNWDGFNGSVAGQVEINGVSVSNATVRYLASTYAVYDLDPATFGITGAGSYSYEETGSADSSYQGTQGLAGAVLAVLYEDTTLTGRRFVFLAVDDLTNSYEWMYDLPTAGTTGEGIFSAGLTWECSDEQSSYLYYGSTSLTTRAGGRDDGPDTDAACASQDWNSLITVGSFGFDDTDTWIGTDGDDPDTEPGGSSTDSRASDELYAVNYGERGYSYYYHYERGRSADARLSTVALVIEMDTDEDGIRDADDNCPDDANTDQADADGDDVGDVCDTCTDVDGDGYGASGATSCEPDCDDGDAAIHPGATDVCDGIDNDCDGSLDEDDTSGGDTWYEDADGDGIGNADSILVACGRPPGYVATAGDCDDTDARVSTGAPEACNGYDDDCDGLVDEGDAADATRWYRDDDADGFGDAAFPIDACDEPEGYVADDRDCDDGDAAVSPVATEACNGLDDDCDGATDEAGATGGTTWYADADQDGYGDAASPVTACNRPDGAIADDRDCDDTDAAVNPAGAEAWYDGIDQDCDGNDADRDLDGYAWAGAGGTDCDDENSVVYPGAPDAWYDGLDTDCAGNSDYDADADGHDSASYAGDDCDDADADVYPGAPDDPYDGNVHDCDAADEFDQDGDGYTVQAGPGEDCDDNNSDIHPGAEETWYDGVDQDCDDRDDDQDGDGFALEADCDDTDPALYPSAPGYDADCEPVVEGDTGAVAVDEEEPGLYKGGGGCGCVAGGGAGVGWAGALLGLLALRRRR